MQIAVLPGLDGTGRLSEDFLSELPRELSPVLLDLPRTGPQDYGSLVEHLVPRLPTDTDLVLLGESFSGRLAFELATRLPTVKALVLSASFLESPRPWFRPARYLPLSKIGLRSSPEWVLRKFCVDSETPPPRLELLGQILQDVPAKVLAARLRAVLRLLPPEASLEIPCLYLHPSDDRLVPLRGLDSVRRHCNNLAVTGISGPHFLLFERPKECAAEVGAWLQGRGRG